MAGAENSEGEAVKLETDSVTVEMEAVLGAAVVAADVSAAAEGKAAGRVVPAATVGVMAVAEVKAGWAVPVASAVVPGVAAGAKSA